MGNEEEHQLLRFLEFQGISEGQFDFYPKGKNYPPDAQIRTNNSLVSLEHTRLVKPELKRYSVLRSRVFTECKSLCDWEKYSVHILFKSGVLHDSKVSSLAEEIANIVYCCSELIGSERLRIDSEHVIISLRKSMELERKKWKFVEDSVGWVTQTLDPFVEAINKKQGRLLTYRDGYDSNWLLVCYDRYKAHGFFDFDLADPITTTFDRIFIMTEDQVVEMKSS